MPLRISPIDNQHRFRAQAHRFRQGGRDVYYFTLDLETLDGLLPQRVEDDVAREANRRLTPSHAKNIQVYLDEKDDWLLGALMLGIAPDAVEFEPYSDDMPNFGELRVLANRANTMRIFDGQHRRRAIQNVLAELPGFTDERSAGKLDSLRKASMSIVLYAEDNLRTLRQMFSDASQTKHIEPHTVTRFDRRDPFNRTAVKLADASLMFKGRVEMERSSVAVSNINVIAINQLAAMLKILEVGPRGRVSRDLREACMMDLDGLHERCREWADEFMPAAREEYKGLITGEIADSEIPQLRALTFAYNATFFRVLAACYHLWTRERGSWKPLAEFIRKASIRQGDKHGLLADAGLIEPSGRLFSRRQEVAASINHIVEAAKAAS